MYGSASSRISCEYTSYCTIARLAAIRLQIELLPYWGFLTRGVILVCSYARSEQTTIIGDYINYHGRERMKRSFCVAPFPVEIAALDKLDGARLIMIFTHAS